MTSFSLLISGAALAVSIVSIWLNKINWDRSNRPIVTAFITERGPSNKSNTFDLVVSNTGNRPAVNVQLHADHNDFLKLIESDAAPEKLESVSQCFLDESKIPVLRNGEELTTAFGVFDKENKENKWLNYGAEIEIKITYRDIEGAYYESKMPLKIYARTGFGGSSWI